MGELIASSVADLPKPSLLIPVPQHPERLRERGFDHAGFLAKILGQRLTIPVETRLVGNTDVRQSQSELGAKERQKNMHDAFRACKQINRHHVTVVDDVVTTGATSQAMARALNAGGCERVSVWAFARTP